MKLTVKPSVVMIYFNILLNNRVDDNLIDHWLQTAHENVGAHHKNCNIALKEGRMRKTGIHSQVLLAVAQIYSEVPSAFFQMRDNPGLPTNIPSQENKTQQ